MHARRVKTVLVRVAVHGEIQEIDADAAVIEQRIALAGRAVAAQSSAFILEADQK